MPSNSRSRGADPDMPWRNYCEELISRNREMQEQITYARQRIAALAHGNQNLHLLVDRMDRDRERLVFENDLLQTQLHGFEDHERQQEALMRELAALRRRMKRRDHFLDRGFFEHELSSSRDHGDSGVVIDLEGGMLSLGELEEQLAHSIASSRRLDDLKEWENMLESSLSRVRSIKEDIAVELQKKLDERTEEQVTAEHKQCVVCLTREKSILCLPCRHLCLCRECSQLQQLEKCPICRNVVESMLQVYA
ncbi:hypothetical protein PINS_up002248 [Pythium insidiosum]|nr:hypothetical protein PINS_up002248 [Pythium insidiosum]